MGAIEDAQKALDDAAKAIKDQSDKQAAAITNPITDAFKALQKEIQDGLIICAAVGVAAVVGLFIVKFLWTKAFPSEYQMMLHAQAQWMQPEAVGKVAGAAMGNPAALIPH